MCFNSCNPHLSQNSSLQTLLFFIQGSSLSLTLSCSGTLPCFPRWLPIIAPIAGINYYIFNIKPDTAAYLLSLNASPVISIGRLCLKFQHDLRADTADTGREKNPLSPGIGLLASDRAPDPESRVMEQE